MDWLVVLAALACLVQGKHLVGAVFLPGTRTPIKILDKVSLDMTKKYLECSFVKDADSYKDYAKANLNGKFIPVKF